MIRKPNLKLNWKYAIGEVVLIFIGITMAFALQQWANSQNEIRKGKRYLEAFKVELESNHETVKAHAELTKESVEQLKYYLELMNSDSAKALNDFQITEMIQNIGPSYYNSLSVAAYQDIINSGGMEYIIDPIIRRNFIQYGVFLMEYESRVKKSLDQWYAELSPYFMEYSDLSQMNIRGMTFNFSDKIFSHDKDAFIQNRTFTNILRSRIIWQLSVVNFISNEIEDLERFDQQVKTYLEQ